MLSQANKHGNSTYVPRKPHPLLVGTQASETDAETVEIDALLYHTAHHNDTIDSRDLAEYGGEDNQREDDTKEAQSS